MKKKIIAAFLAFALCFSCCGTSFAATTTEVVLDHGMSEEENAKLNELMFNYYKNVVELICEAYPLANITPEQVYAAFIKQLIGTDPKMVEEAVRVAADGLDKNSYYLSLEEYEEYYSHLASDYCGIGLIAGSKNGPITVIGFPAEVTPAKTAGVQVGDIILSVDGASLEGYTANDAASLMKGEKGSVVRLGLKRGDATLEISVTRGDVEQNAVSYTVDGDIMYISLSTFNEGSSKKMEEALKSADKQKIKKIILDLRGNGGGIGTECYGIASLLMPKGKLITEIVYNNEELNESHYSKADFNFKKYDIAVLVNESSASCSEMLAGALKDHGLGYVIGVNTYGKSTGQQVIPLDALQGYLKLTVSQYHTPSGQPIPDDGITPDKYLKNKRVPINSSDDFHTMTFLRKLSKGDSGDDVIACKERLELLGYYVGDTQNAEFDRLLESVVAKFQSDSGLYSYGVLDTSTMYELFNQTKDFEVEEDTQLEYAKEYLNNR